MKNLTVILIVSFALLSCDTGTSPGTANPLVECPTDIANQVLSYAYEYSEADTEYKYGCQDLLRSIKVDCSGLVVNCYAYAVDGTDYSLPFNDAAVIHFYTKWTVRTNNPRPGDLIFMGDDSEYPSHMSIFVKKEDGNIYFIDSTYKPENELNGVTERYYPEDDPKFLSYGILLLLYYHPK